MGTLKTNAKDIATKMLKEKSTIAFYFAIQEDIEKGYSTVFATNMQSYITRLGLIVSTCYGEKLSANTFLGSISYLCNYLLHDKLLYNLLRAIQVNENSNNGKHSLKNVEIDIKECVYQYNKLITKLIDKTKLTAFKVCYFTTKKKENVRDIPLFDEKKNHVYGSLCGFDYQIKISNEYDYDRYRKTVNSKITIYWPKGLKDKLISVTVENTINNKIMLSAKDIDVSNNESKKAYGLVLPEEALNKRVLSLKVTLKLYTKSTEYYSSGHLWFKNYWHKDIIKDIGEKSEIISQIYYPKASK